MASSPTAADAAWRAAVEVREVPELARLLADRLPPEPSPRALSVTDLLGPRRAFWRSVTPVPFSTERQHRVDLGRALHRRLGVALSTEGALEVRVRRDGVVGRIDLLSDVPVEVKTSSSSVEANQLSEARPDHVEQLGMYCALSGRESGRLVTLVVNDATVGRIRAVDIEFGDMDSVRGEMRRRTEGLRHAWSGGNAGDLPPCRWFGRGCEFQVGGVCDCAPSPPAAPSPIITAVRKTTERFDVSERIESRLKEVPEPATSPTLERFRDLLHPRRAYYERTAVAPAAETPRRSPQEPMDLYARLSEAVEAGPLGEVARLPPRTDEPEEEVGGFRGVPYLLRTSRARDRASSATVMDRQPQYAFELGLRCVATGSTTGYLFLGREGATIDRDRVQAFEYRVAPASAFARVWRDRSRHLAAALSARSPLDLSPCPGWMYPDCPYRSECACGASGVRSQR